VPVLAPSTHLRPDTAPADLGFDPLRLARIDEHFERYVHDGRLAGWLIMVTRHGRIAHLACCGRRDIEADAAVTPDTVWRIYSMTKPITSVAAMMLWEQGAFELKDEVARFIPAFANTRVYRSGAAPQPVTEPLMEPVRMWHLLTHTSGLTYGFHHHQPVDAMYRAAGFDMGTPPGRDLAACCETWAKLPLLFQPGREWNYGVSTDVLGRVVEAISGQSLEQFLTEHIFKPLGMGQTGFHATSDQADRLAALYSPDPVSGKAKRNDELGDAALSPPTCLSGGGGLVSTAADYHRFTQMLLGEGRLGDTRLLGTRTVRLMAANQLPGHADLEAFGRPLFAETTFDGMGFGLGFSVVEDPVATRYAPSRGEFGWGGAASTAFWVDPAQQMTVLLLTQMLPSSTFPLRSQLHQLVAQALVD